MSKCVSLDNHLFIQLERKQIVTVIALLLFAQLAFAKATLLLAADAHIPAAATDVRVNVKPDAKG